MSNSVFKKDGTVEERLSGLEKYLEDLSLHRDSRRGLEGPAGKNSTVPGPQGPPGQDADIKKVIYAAEENMHQVLEEVIANLQKFTRDDIYYLLKKVGAVDSDGKAILLPGPAGRDGADSQVAGPSGRDGADGKSIVGPPGRDLRDAKIQLGSVTAGPEASVTLREEDGVQVLDFVLPRGEKGDTGATGATGVGEKGDSIIGPEGQRGLPGVGLSREAVVALVIDMKKRGSL